MEASDLLQTIDAQLHALSTAMDEVRARLAQAESGTPSQQTPDFSQPPGRLTYTTTSQQINYTTTSQEHGQDSESGDPSMLSISTSSSTSSSSTSSSLDEPEVDVKEVWTKLVTRQFVSYLEQDALKEKGIVFDDMTLIRERMKLGVKLTNKEKDLLWETDGLYPYSGDLQTRSGDIDIEEARRLLKEAEEPSESESPDDGGGGIPEVPPVQSIYTYGGKEDAPPTTYSSNGTTNYSSNETTNMESSHELLDISSTSSSLSELSVYNSAFQDPAAVIGDPVLAEKVRKALAKESRARLDASITEGEIALREQIAFDARQAQAEIDRKEAEEQKKTRQEAFRTHVKTEQEQLQQDQDLYISSSLLRENNQEQTYQQLHQGEFEKYNTGVQSVILTGAMGSSSVQENLLTAQDGSVISTLKTRKLEGEDLEKQKMHGEDGLLRRGDGSLLDTSESESIIGFGGSGKGQESWVLTQEDELLSAGQIQISTNVPELREAQQRLQAARGRTRPKNREEAEEFGFPSDVFAGHHTSLSGGEDVRGAGELEVEGGKVKKISNASGHYQPDAESTLKVLDKLDEQGAVDRSAGGTKVEVYNEQGTKEEFQSSEALASGGDIARARALRREREERGQEFDPSSLTNEQQAVLDHHQPQIEARQTHAREKFHERRKKLQSRVTWLEERLRVLRGQDLEGMAALENLEEIFAAEEKLNKTLEKIQETDHFLKQVLGQIADLIRQLEDALRSAGVDEDVLAGLLRQQRRGIGVLNEAETELISWMNGLTDRRRELQQLRALSKDEDFQARKRTAKERLEQALGGKRKEND